MAENEDRTELLDLHRIYIDFHGSQNRFFALATYKCSMRIFQQLHPPFTPLVGLPRNVPHSPRSSVPQWEPQSESCSQRWCCASEKLFVVLDAAVYCVYWFGRKFGSDRRIVLGSFWFGGKIYCKKCSES